MQIGESKRGRMRASSALRVFAVGYLSDELFAAFASDAPPPLRKARIGQVYAAIGQLAPPVPVA